MDIQCPEGVTSVSVEGVQYTPDDKGVIADMINAHAATLLARADGFTVAIDDQGVTAVSEPPEAADPGEAGSSVAKGTTVAQLTEMLTARGVAIPPGAKKADLMAMVEEMVAAASANATDASANGGADANA